MHAPENKSTIVQREAPLNVHELAYVPPTKVERGHSANRVLRYPGLQHAMKVHVFLVSSYNINFIWSQGKVNIIVKQIQYFQLNDISVCLFI